MVYKLWNNLLLEKSVAFFVKAFWNEDRYKDGGDIYGETSREELVEGDELTPEEDGFMQGYMES